MRIGYRTHQPRGKICYKQLRQINPEAARRAVIEYLKSNGIISPKRHWFSG